ncbi:MAG: hypothetical protein HYV17_07845 [Xanthomonadales bacterium]|nr:hypothetical protein [Xanthomonadales bacterium]
MKKARRRRYCMLVRELVPGVDRHGFVWEVTDHKSSEVVLRDIAAAEDIAVVVAYEQMERLEHAS